MMPTRNRSPSETEAGYRDGGIRVLFKSAEVKRYSHIQVITTMIRDITGSLTLTWYNMPYLHATLKAGMRAVFRGRVVKKNGRLTMEQPEIFLGDAYGEVIHSMQPSTDRQRDFPTRPLCGQ